MYASRARDLQGLETYLEEKYTDRTFREMVDCRNIGRANKGDAPLKCCGRNYLHLQGMLRSKHTRLAMQIAKGTTEMHFQEIDEMEIERLHIVFFLRPGSPQKCFCCIRICMDVDVQRL